ncbi:MAG: thioesterase family protein [Lentisphaeria bacterium]|nr:thioesterase family protein [Lentisphaeria bacterium]NQZ70769.1 thioesterase family protein [Lentisphaeria bacterium]
MPRIKLEKLDNYRFCCTLNIRVGDLNYGSHLANDAVVALAHQARIEFFESLGVTELDLGDGKTGLIMADLAVNFLAEGFLNDSLDVYCDVTELTAKSFRMCHSLVRADEEIARVECGLLAFSYDERKVVRLPESFIKKIKGDIK